MAYIAAREILNDSKEPDKRAKEIKMHPLVDNELFVHFKKKSSMIWFIFWNFSPTVLGRMAG